VPETIWIGLIAFALWGGAAWFCLKTGTVPFNLWNVYREDNPVVFWIFVGLFALVSGIGFAMTVYGVWTAYLAPSFG